MDPIEREQTSILLKDKLIDLQQQIPHFKTWPKQEFPMLEKLLEYHRKTNRATKKKILGYPFLKRFVLENEKNATGNFIKHVQLIMRIGKGLGQS